MAAVGDVSSVPCNVALVGSVFVWIDRELEEEEASLERRTEENRINFLEAVEQATRDLRAFQRKQVRLGDVLRLSCIGMPMSSYARVVWERHDMEVAGRPGRR